PVDRPEVESRPGDGGEHIGAGVATVALRRRQAPLLRARGDGRDLRQHKSEAGQLTLQQSPEEAAGSAPAASLFGYCVRVAPRADSPGAEGGPGERGTFLRLQA